MKQNKLDEMQEQALLKIEHNGCWFAFWGLLVMMAAEALLGFGVKTMAGEWIIFMALALYLCIDCIRHGIWDRRLKASGKTNLIVSLLAAVSVGIFSCFMANRYATEILDYLLTGISSAVITFILCFAALSFGMALYKKRRDKLEQE